MPKTGFLPNTSFPKREIYAQRHDEVFDQFTLFKNTPITTTDSKSSTENLPSLLKIQISTSQLPHKLESLKFPPHDAAPSYSKLSPGPSDYVSCLWEQLHRFGLSPSQEFLNIYPWAISNSPFQTSSNHHLRSMDATPNKVWIMA